MKIVARNGIELGPGVELSPNESGGILLEMDPELEFSCPEKLPENREVVLPNTKKVLKRDFGNKGN